jgi:hypothetical protein
MRLRFLDVLFFGLALGIFGTACRAKPEPADPGQTRETLHSALTAWQNGDAAESLRNRQPPITAADPQWHEKYRLLRFEIAEQGQPAGFDHRYRVVLWLQGPDGTEAKEDAVFTVSTKPKRVVVRDES